MLFFVIRFAVGKSDKEILDNLLIETRYDKRLLPPILGISLKLITNNYNYNF